MANILASLVVESTVMDDGFYRVTIVQTGIDTADVDVRKWHIGDDYTASPHSDAQHSLWEVREHNGVIVARTTLLLWITTTLTLFLSGPGVTPSLTVNSKTYPISQEAHDEAVAFLAAARFPIG